MRKFLGWVVLVGVLVAGAILAGQVANAWNNRHWDGRNRFTLISMNKKDQTAELYSIDPESGQAIHLVLPSEMEVDTIGGRGVWKISAVVSLADKYGPVWAADSIANFLDIPYTAVKEKIDVWDKLSWWNLSRGVDFQDISLKNTDLVRKIETPDGETVLGLTSWWQNKAGDLFYSSNLAKEELNVEVYNTTNVTGLASRVAQLLENAGVKVTITGEAGEIAGRCQVASSHQMVSDPGVEWITRFMSCSRIEKNDLDTKQVQIYLGNDYVSWLKGAF